MAQRDECLEGQGFLRGRMVFGYNADIGRRHQGLALKVCPANAGHINGKVQPAGGEFGRDRAPVQLGPGNAHTGRNVLQAPRKPWGDHECPGVAGRDIEHPRRAGGLEHRARLQSGAQAVQRVAHGRHQRFGHGGRLHAAPFAHKQRVLEMGAQPGQRIADRRLRDVQELARPRQAAFGIDGLQHGQQVQVQ